MRSVIRFSMKNTVAVFLIVAVLVGAGLFAVNQMKMEKYPDIDIPYLHVSIVYPGASPEQAMRDIGEKLEKEFANIDGVVGVYAWGYPNSFYSVLKTDMASDIDSIEEEVRSAVAKTELPEDAREPQVFTEKLEPDIYSITFSGADQAAVQRFVEEQVEPAIRSVQGVDQVNIRGAVNKNVYISVRPDDLKEKGLTLDQVRQLITANHVSIPVGDLRTDEQILPIRIDETLQSVEDIKNIRLTAVPTPESLQVPGGKLQSFRLSDIADVTFDPADTAISRMNGLPAITVTVSAKGGEDAVRAVKEIQRTVDKLAVPAGIDQEVLLDQSKDIEHSVNSMLREVILGAIMAVIVTLLFLRNLRSTLIAIISIPLSMFASFIVLNYFDYTLNMMTLAGIAVATGRVVDDSIVVIENVFRRVSGVQHRNDELVERSTREVASAITSSTLTTVAVFLPLAFVPGIVGKFFVPLAWTVVISLLFSLLVAVTVVPLMSRLFLLKVKHVEPKENRIQRTYRRTLNWVLKHRLITLSLAVLLLLGSAAIPALGLIGFNFLPSEKATTFNVNIDMPIGSNVAMTERVANQVEDAVEKHADALRINTYVSNESGRVSFKVDTDTDTDKMAEQLRSEFDNIQGAQSIVLAGVGMFGSSYLNIIVNGPNRETILEGSEQIAQALKEVDGLEDVRSSAEGEKPEVAIDFDHEALAENGLTPAEVAMTLRTMVEGSAITRADIDGKPSDVILKLHSDQTSDMEQLKEQELTNRLGLPVKLIEIGDVNLTMGPTVVSHLDQKEYMEVYGTITDENSSKVTSDAFAAIEALKLCRTG